MGATILKLKGKFNSDNITTNINQLNLVIFNEHSELVLEVRLFEEDINYPIKALSTTTPPADSDELVYNVAKSIKHNSAQLGDKWMGLFPGVTKDSLPELVAVVNLDLIISNDEAEVSVNELEAYAINLHDEVERLGIKIQASNEYNINTGDVEKSAKEASISSVLTLVKEADLNLISVKILDEYNYKLGIYIPEFYFSDEKISELVRNLVERSVDAIANGVLVETRFEDVSLSGEDFIKLTYRSTKD